MYLRYYSPTFNQGEHKKIISLLEEISRLHGIEYEEVVVKQREWYSKSKDKTEASVYENDLKPYRGVISSNSDILYGEGVKVYRGSVTKKFKKASNRQKNFEVSGTISVVEGDATLWAGVRGEAIDFLDHLLKRGQYLLNKLDKSRKKVEIAKHESERELKEGFVSDYLSRGYRCFKDVKHNISLGRNISQDFQFVFKPDADIIAVNEQNTRILGLEAKGYVRSKGRKQKADIYKAIGEALMYLKNPSIKYKGEKLGGGIFDVVYLCYPYEDDFLEIKDVMELTPIGLWAASEGTIKEPQQNPFINKRKKEIFLSNLDSLGVYEY